MRIYNIPVSVKKDMGLYCATDYTVHMYGSGITREAAIEDYKSAIREYREELKKGNIGHNLKRHLDYLEGKPIQ